MICAGGAGATSCMVRPPPADPAHVAFFCVSPLLSGVPFFAPPDRLLLCLRETLVVLWSARRTTPGLWLESCPGAAAGATPPLPPSTPVSPSSAARLTRSLLPTKRSEAEPPPAPPKVPDPSKPPGLAQNDNKTFKPHCFLSDLGSIRQTRITSRGWLLDGILAHSFIFISLTRGVPQGSTVGPLFVQFTC